jgi:hypothetical protein
MPSVRALPAPTLLIDDHGRVTDSRSLSLRASLNALQVGDAFTDYAIRNLGFAAVRMIRTAAHVRLRPTHVAPTAFCGLMDWLSDRRPERVLLSWLDAGSWSHAVFGTSEAAAQRLDSLVSRAQCLGSGDLLARRPVARRRARIPSSHTAAAGET